jgi:GntR family transcriptional regulator
MSVMQATKRKAVESPVAASHSSGPGLIDQASPVPVFIQVEQDIRRQILSGGYKTGDRLPRETELAKIYGISRMTVRHALEGLANAKLIRRAHGVGTTVISPPAPVVFNLGLMVSFSDQLRRQGFGLKTVTEMQAEVRPPDHISKALGMRSGEKAVAIRRVRVVENHPLALTTSWLRATRFPGLAERELTQGSLWATLEDFYGVKVKNSENAVEMIQATALEAHLLHITTDDELLSFTGIVYDTDDQPVEYMTALWSRQVRFNFSISAPTAPTASRAAPASRPKLAQRR